MNKQKQLIKTFIFIKYLLDVIPNYIYLIKFLKSEVYIYVHLNKIKNFMFFMKNHCNSNFAQLVDLCGVDYLGKNQRFQIIYNLLSIYYNFRLSIKLCCNEKNVVPSLHNIYKSAG